MSAAGEKTAMPDWMKVITGGKEMPDWSPPSIAKPPDSPEQTDRPPKERQHCWHLDGEIDEAHMKVPMVCCTCGMKHIQNLVRRPPSGHGYFVPERQKMLQGSD